MIERGINPRRNLLTCKWPIWTSRRVSRYGNEQFYAPVRQVDWIFMVGGEGIRPGTSGNPFPGRRETIADFFFSKTHDIPTIISLRPVAHSSPGRWKFAPRTCFNQNSNCETVRTLRADSFAKFFELSPSHFQVDHPYRPDK